MNSVPFFLVPKLCTLWTRLSANSFDELTGSKSTHVDFSTTSTSDKCNKDLLFRKLLPLDKNMETKGAYKDHDWEKVISPCDGPFSVTEV